MRFARLQVLIAVTLLSLTCFAQQSKSKPPGPPVDDAFVQKQFGATCKLMPGPQPLIGDLDGDGIDDLVIAAKCTNPLLDEAEDNFKLIDPYNTFFGYGDTRVTTQFSSEDPQSRGLVLLVINGSGSEAWRSATPKAKFVIVNLPFKQITLRKLKIRKKSMTAIYTEETGADQTTSVIFWDGKKYRYEPLGASLE